MKDEQLIKLAMLIGRARGFVYSDPKAAADDLDAACQLLERGATTEVFCGYSTREGNRLLEPSLKAQQQAAEQLKESEKWRVNYIEGQSNQDDFDDEAQGMEVEGVEIEGVDIEPISNAEQVNEVCKGVEENVVDTLTEEQKKTPGVAAWRRVVALEAKGRGLTFDQASKLVNRNNPALYGAMLMETGATMEEALRLMQDARR